MPNTGQESTLRLDDMQLYNPGEVAGLLGTSLRHVLRLIADGSLEALNVGMGDRTPRYRVTASSIRGFIEGRLAKLTKSQRPEEPAVRKDLT